MSAADVICFLIAAPLARGAMVVTTDAGSASTVSRALQDCRKTRHPSGAIASPRSLASVALFVMSLRRGEDFSSSVAVLEHVASAAQKPPVLANMRKRPPILPISSFECPPDGRALQQYGDPLAPSSLA